MRYRMFAHSILGQKYKDKGWECQDISDCDEMAGNLQIIAVADGHGSDDCFRSQIGSKLATTTVINLARKSFAENEENKFNGTAIRNFKYALWSEWRKEVKKNWYDNLPSANGANDEIRFAAVSDKYKEYYTSEDEEIMEKYLYDAYGTTLICAVSDGKQLLLLQVGDGTCSVLSKSGEFSAPIPPDEDNFLNKTFSLCKVDENNADAKIRHAVLDYEGTDFEPIAVFLSTDGLDDCYPYADNTKHLFTNFYPVMVKYILEEGYTATEAKIKNEILPYMTDKVSKDDISLAFFITEDTKSLQEAYEQIPDFLAKIKSEE